MGIILWLGICWKVVIWDSDGGHGGAVIVGFLLCVRRIFILGVCVQKTEMGGQFILRGERIDR